MPPDLVALAKVSLVRQHAYSNVTLTSSIRCTLQFTVASRSLTTPASQITQPWQHQARWTPVLPCP